MARFFLLNPWSKMFLESLSNFLFSLIFRLLFNKTSFVELVITLYPFFSANSSTKAKSIHRKSILNLEKAFIFWNFHVAKVKFVYDVFDCKTCLTFDTGGSLAFDKLRAEPSHKQQHLEYTTLATSAVQNLKRTQLSPPFGFVFLIRNRVGDFRTV